MHASTSVIAATAVEDPGKNTKIGNNVKVQGVFEVLSRTNKILITSLVEII